MRDDHIDDDPINDTRSEHALNERDEQNADMWAEGTAQRFTIDRFEDNGWVVLERADGLTFDVPADWMPEEALEGHVLRLEAAIDGKEATLRFTVDQPEAGERRERVRSKLDQLRGR